MTENDLAQLVADWLPDYDLQKDAIDWHQFLRAFKDGEENVHWVDSAKVVADNQVEVQAPDGQWFLITVVEISEEERYR